MSTKKGKIVLPKVEEPTVVYETSKLKSQGIDRETFNFDEEFAKGLTPELAIIESIRKIL